MNSMATVSSSVSTSEKSKSKLLFDAYDDFYKNTNSEYDRGYSKFRRYLDDKHPDLGIDKAFILENFENLTDNRKRMIIMDKLKKMEGKTPEVKEEVIEPVKKLGEFTKEELSKNPTDVITNVVTKDLAEKAVEDSKNTDKQMDMKQGKDDLLSKYKALLDKNNILEKQNTKLKEMAFDKSELIISPREYFRRLKLINMYKRIEKFKEGPGYPKSAVIYFMSMMKFRDGGRLGAAINRGMLKSNIGAFFTKSAGGLNIENLKGEMKTCLDKFSPNDKDSKKVKRMKELIYEEVKTATNTYIDTVAQKNKI